MAAFLSPLCCEKIGARRWLLTDDLVYESDLLPGLFVVPRSFQTDLASTHRLTWIFFPPVDRYDPAGVLHDGAYAGALLTANGERVWVTKYWGDRLFYEALLACGVGRVRAFLMFAAVHLAGNPDAHPLAAHAGAP